MKVTAISPAFFNGSRVRVGDVVEVPEKFKASWAAPTDSVKAKSAKEKPEKQEPKALSELGAGKAKSFIDAHSGDKDLA